MKWMKKNNFSSSLATFWNIIEICKIGTFQRNLSKIFLILLNICFQKYILANLNCDVEMKYFAIFDKNVATIFQSHWSYPPNIFPFLFQPSCFILFAEFCLVYILFQSSCISWSVLILIPLSIFSSNSSLFPFFYCFPYSSLSDLVLSHFKLLSPFCRIPVWNSPNFFP